jgi:aminocarboxymuconate-semialdehyde decarboxylase
MMQETQHASMSGDPDAKAVHVQVIDCHTHTLCPAVNARVADAFKPEFVPYQRDMTDESKAVDDAQKSVLAKRFNDVEERLADMATMGVHRQVVAPAPGQQHYWAPRDLLIEISRIQNDHVAALTEKHAAQLVGLGTLPMTDVDAAMAEATRAVEEKGLRGFQIDSRVLERELSDSGFDPLYAHLAKLDVPLMIHPLGFSHGQRFGAFFMVNTIGQPLEEIIAVNHLIFGGVLDRHPGLRVFVSHGGGYFPFYMGRMDHAWQYRPELRRLTRRRPSDYVRSMWYDSCVYRPDQIKTLVDLAGADRVMLGSDYPFDMGDPDPLGTLHRAGVDAQALAAITEKTAKDLFRLV